MSFGLSLVSTSHLATGITGAGITDALHSTQIFHAGSGDRTQVIRLAQQTLEALNFIYS